MRLIDFGCTKDLPKEVNIAAVRSEEDNYAPIELFSALSPRGPWTDIYSLPATIYFCLTGRMPKPAIERFADGDALVPPSQLGAFISPARERALVKGLEIKGEDRWRTVDEFRKALYEPEIPVLLYGPPRITEEIPAVLYGPPPVNERPAKTGIKKDIIIRTAVVIIVIAGLCMIFALYGGRGEEGSAAMTTGAAAAAERSAGYHSIY